MRLNNLTAHATFICGRLRSMKTLCVLVKSPNATSGFWMIDLQAKEASIEPSSRLLLISGDTGPVGEFSLEALVGWHWKQD